MEEKKYSILVVDDEESMREFLAIMLHREGYKVTVAEDGAQALVCLNNNSYDLIISDIQMPRLDGFKLLKHVQEHCPETVMIMITAFSTTEEAVEAMKNGPTITSSSLSKMRKSDLSSKMPWRGRFSARKILN